MKLFITGVKHCGKSTVGKLLAKSLKIPFFDLDDIIESEIGMGVRDFYKSEGRERFLEEEFKSIEKLNLMGLDSYICSTGGGICDNNLVFKNLSSFGSIIYLKEQFEVIYGRVIRGGIPGFIKSNNPKEEFHNIYLSRSQKYFEAASIVIDVHNKMPKDIIKEIKKGITSVRK